MGQAFSIWSNRCFWSLVKLPVADNSHTKRFTGIPSLSVILTRFTVTLNSPTSHCLRWAYILSVIALQEASDIQRKSPGEGPSLLPPAETGSSAVKLKPRLSSQVL